MGSHGYVKLYRSLFRHEFFRPSRFSEREAFTWMIAEAAWKLRQRRVGQFFVDLDRGELAASLRHLADVWGWEVGAVRGYLARSEKAGMLSTRSDKGITIVTVCNYDVYQGDENPDDTVDDKVSAQGQQGPSTGPAHGQHKTEEIKQSRREEGKEDLTASGCSIALPSDLLGGDGSSRNPKASRAKPRTRVDPNFSLAEDDRLYARSRGWSEQIIDQQLEKFRNFHASKGNLMASWPAAWRTWVGNGYDFRGGKPGAPATPNRADSAIEGMFSDLTKEDFHGRAR